MAQDLSKVYVSRNKALAIMEQVRPRLVEHLKNGMQREDANREVADWLRGENNILSPYADEVVAGLLVSDNEITMRREFGDEFCDAWAKAMNGIKKQ